MATALARRADPPIKHELLERHAMLRAKHMAKHTLRPENDITKWQTELRAATTLLSREIGKFEDLSSNEKFRIVRVLESIVNTIGWVDFSQNLREIPLRILQNCRNTSDPSILRDINEVVNILRRTNTAPIIKITIERTHSTEFVQGVAYQAYLQRQKTAETETEPEWEPDTRTSWKTVLDARLGRIAKKSYKLIFLSREQKRKIEQSIQAVYNAMRVPMQSRGSLSDLISTMQSTNIALQDQIVIAENVRTRIPTRTPIIEGLTAIEAQLTVNLKDTVKQWLTEILPVKLVIRAITAIGTMTIFVASLGKTSNLQEQKVIVRPIDNHDEWYQ